MVLRGTIEVVYEKVSATLQERGYEFRRSGAYGTAVSFLKNSFLLFQLFSSPYIFFVLSPVCVHNAA